MYNHESGTQWVPDFLCIQIIVRNSWAAVGNINDPTTAEAVTCQHKLHGVVIVMGVDANMGNLTQAKIKGRRKDPAGSISGNSVNGTVGHLAPPGAALHMTIGRIRGVFYFVIGPDPTYSVIEDGGWLSDEPYGTIHRIASDGSGGLFSAVLKFCRSRIGHIRIDTHHDNRVMQHVVEKHGFSRRGIIFLANGDPRIAYEMI